MRVASVWVGLVVRVGASGVGGHVVRVGASGMGGLVVRGWWCGRASGEGLVVWGGEGLVVRGRDWWCERRANGMERG